MIGKLIADLTAINVPKIKNGQGFVGYRYLQVNKLRKNGFLGQKMTKHRTLFWA